MYNVIADVLESRMEQVPNVPYRDSQQEGMD